MKSNLLILKYRPSDFDEVVGQQKILASLKQTLKQDSAHSFIFTGPSGVGKTTLARIIASKVGCDLSNLKEIDAATFTGIDAMRDIASMMEFRSITESPVKVMIVDEAHALSKQAWQALLKSIEEPPLHAYWIFCTTELHKIPDTIRTRCLVYELQPISIDDIIDLLEKIAEGEKIEASQDTLRLIAKRAEGSLRRAISAFAQCGWMESDDAAEVLRTFQEGSDDVTVLARLLLSGKASWKQIIEVLQDLKDQSPEGIRIVLLRYFSSVLMNTKTDEQAARMMNYLQAFSESYISAEGFAPLLLSVGSLLYRGD